MMKHKNNYIALCTVACVISLAACSDDDSFTTSRSNLLSFDTDTLSLDTVFSTVPSPSKIFMVRNESGDGIRIQNVRLQNGNQTGFRVNVNGTYLSEEAGFQTNDMELRDGDSLRVFVELTTALTNDTLPKLVGDNLVFTLESGVSQQVRLQAWSWDAWLLNNVFVSKDSTVSNEHGKPVVIYGGMTVGEGATLTIAPGTTLYFHDDAGLDVKGTLKVQGEPGREVTMRCDRLDRMVSNLTYDNNPGQWQGITIDSASVNNEIVYTDIHGATYGINVLQQPDSTMQKLTLRNSTVHNIKGNGVYIDRGKAQIENTQISNTLGTSLYVAGATVDVNNSTIAQYYPFDSSRGNAIYFSNSQADPFSAIHMTVRNSIVKGYADDEVIWARDTLMPQMDVRFEDNLLRTVMPTDFDSLMFVNNIMEDTQDTLTNGRNSFSLFDTYYFFYDFTPKEGSPAIGAANPLTATKTDRTGRARDEEAPDMGCFETDKAVKEDN